jgi:hypothetical protein
MDGWDNLSEFCLSHCERDTCMKQRAQTESNAVLRVNVKATYYENL